MATVGVEGLMPSHQINARLLMLMLSGNVNTDVNYDQPETR